MVSVDSEALAAVGYDAVARTLRVRFAHGGLYDYFDVPAQVYEGLIADEHPWTIWGEHVKASYAYKRIQ